MQWLDLFMPPGGVYRSAALLHKFTPFKTGIALPKAHVHHYQDLPMSSKFLRHASCPATSLYLRPCSRCAWLFCSQGQLWLSLLCLHSSLVFAGPSPSLFLEGGSSLASGNPTALTTGLLLICSLPSRRTSAGWRGLFSL